MGTTETALVPQKARSLKTLLGGDEFKRAVAQALPRHLPAERFIRVAITALTRVPKLQRCTHESFFKCLLDLSAMGLEPDGRHAHLIPFENSKLCACGHFFNRHNEKRCLDCTCVNRSKAVECTLIVDYKGLVQLVRRSEEVSYIHADVVYDGDSFDYCYGTGAFLKHKPALDGKRERLIAAYSFVRMKDGSEDFLVWGPSRLEAARQRSKAKDDGPWVGTQEDQDEMRKKSVFRNQSKWLPFSPEVKSLIERADDAIDLPSSEFGAYDPDAEENVRRAKLMELIGDGNIDGARKMAESWEIDFAPYEEAHQDDHATQSGNGQLGGPTTTATEERAAQPEQPTAAPSGKASVGSPPESALRKQCREGLDFIGPQSAGRILGSELGAENLGQVSEGKLPKLSLLIEREINDQATARNKPEVKPEGAKRFNFSKENGK